MILNLLILILSFLPIGTDGKPMNCKTELLMNDIFGSNSIWTSFSTNIPMRKMF